MNLPFGMGNNSEGCAINRTIQSTRAESTGALVFSSAAHADLMANPLFGATDSPYD
jgi:hypothetical protein